VLYAEKNKSKLKKLDFSKNKKLRDIVIGQTKALKNIKFNKMLFSMRNKLSTTTSTTQVRFYTN